MAKVTMQKNVTITLNGTTWHFSHDRITYRGVPLFEIIASDVTGEYSATEKLIRGNEELKRMNAEMRRYNQNIDDTMRKQIDGLAAMVELQYGQTLDERSIFLFCGHRADRIKALYWGGPGYVLLYKRLPESLSGSREIGRTCQLLNNTICKNLTMDIFGNSRQTALWSILRSHSDADIMHLAWGRGSQLSGTDLQRLFIQHY